MSNLDKEINKKLIIRLDTIGGYFSSRSEARDILKDVIDFNTLTFDFEHVSNIYQAFADEIYRVFQTKHPEIKIENEHMNEAVKFMVERAKKEAKVGRN